MHEVIAQCVRFEPQSDAPDLPTPTMPGNDLRLLVPSDSYDGGTTTGR